MAPKPLLPPPLPQTFWVPLLNADLALTAGQSMGSAGNINLLSFLIITSLKFNLYIYIYSIVTSLLA